MIGQVSQSLRLVDCHVGGNQPYVGCRRWNRPFNVGLSHSKQTR